MLLSKSQYLRGLQCLKSLWLYKNRPELAKRLLQDMAPNGTIVAFNKSFEIRVIKELALNLPQFQKRLYALIDRFEDLIEPFRNLGYYHPDFHDSFFFKSVLPALFPQDYELDFKKLGSVQNVVKRWRFLQSCIYSKTDPKEMRYEKICWHTAG